MKKTNIISKATYGRALKDLINVHKRFRIDSLLLKSFTSLKKSLIATVYNTYELKSIIIMKCNVRFKFKYLIARNSRKKFMLNPAPPSLKFAIAISRKEPITITKSNAFQGSRKYSYNIGND